MNALRVLLISSVIPRDSTGGELVLYRHFSQFPGLDLAIATDDCKDLLFTTNIIEIKANRLLTRLTRTRFYKWIHALLQCFKTFHKTKKIREYIRNEKPDIILTVAHHELCWVAQEISQEFDIPLITFFHDWWPDMAYVHSFTRKILARRFKQLYQRSQLAFCVSEEMRQALGTHPNAQILFPIPDRLVIKDDLVNLQQGSEFTVVYAGSLSGIYRPMLQSLCTLIQSIPEVQFKLKLFGPPLDWSDLLVQQLTAKQIYGGFISRDLLIHELSKANALLVVMSFNQADWTRMQTSFPSKLIEYCQFGKPIIIWGPDYSSAVRWGCRHQSALVVTSPCAKDLVKALQELATQPEEQKRLINKALEMAEGMFNQDKIQQQFVNSLNHVAIVNSQKRNNFI